MITYTTYSTKVVYRLPVPHITPSFSRGPPIKHREIVTSLNYHHFGKPRSQGPLSEYPGNEVALWPGGSKVVNRRLHVRW